MDEAAHLVGVDEEEDEQDQLSQEDDQQHDEELGKERTRSALSTTPKHDTLRHLLQD